MSKKVFIIPIIILTVIATAFFYVYFQIYCPQNRYGSQIEFAIEPGETAKQICDRLESQKIVRNSFWLESYLWLLGQRSQLKAGHYSLGPNLNIPQVVNLLTMMPPAKSELVIVLPEGIKTDQIIDKIAQAKIVDSADLTTEINNLPKYQLNYDFLSTATTDADLTGFLFPDTYRFYQNTDVAIVMQKILDNFDGKLTPKMRQDIIAQDKTIYDIVIMASVIEKEVVSDNDRSIVSDIFWRRLSDKYPLQSCATIAYAMSLDKWRYSELDLEINSPYNTYTNKGLPPGPICNPGLSAITAAIYPQANDYYFFLSAPDGQTIFSKTGEEHSKNKIKYLE